MTIILTIIGVLAGIILAQTEYVKNLLLQFGIKDFEPIEIKEPINLQPILDQLEEIKKGIDDRIVRNQIALVKLIQSLPDEFINRMDTDKLIEFIKNEGFKGTGEVNINSSGNLSLANEKPTYKLGVIGTVTNKLTKI